MSNPHHPRSGAPRPGDPTGINASAPAGPAAIPGSRPQPPLQEVLKGLDSRELEGQTVFDQLFGPLPEGDPRLPSR